MLNNVTEQTVTSSVENVMGWDIDPNACQATELSLALLHLVLLNKLPDNLPILVTESLQHFLDHPEVHDTLDVVLANPPFVRYELLSNDLKERMGLVLGQYGQGRSDLYLAFLMLGLKLLKPGGIACFVVPQSFLTGKSSGEMRKLIIESAWVLCLADLTNIRVFPGVSAYVSLVIFQKKFDGSPAPKATLVRAQDLAGKALMDAVIGRTIDNNYYSVFPVEQRFFHDNPAWIVLRPGEERLKERLSSFPHVGEFLEINQGFITGLDRVFIRPKSEVSKSERSIYRQYLPDRQMKKYASPKAVEDLVFYPFNEDGDKITEEQLIKAYPDTWRYLTSHRAQLEKRSGKRAHWWEPTRSRSPRNMMRPKIMTPHLTLEPRFSIDMSGQYAVSRSPFLYPKDHQFEEQYLLFFAAVLNSPVAYWFMKINSTNFDKGYSMLEGPSIKSTPVPDPRTVPPTQMSKILNLVRARCNEFNDQKLMELDRQIDSAIGELYGLSVEEQVMLGYQHASD